MNMHVPTASETKDNLCKRLHLGTFEWPVNSGKNQATNSSVLFYSIQTSVLEWQRLQLPYYKNNNC